MTASREDTNNCVLSDSHKLEFHSLGNLCFLGTNITSGRKRVRGVVECYYRIIEVDGFSL